MALLNAKQIKALYDRGENVMRALRESEQQEVNSRTTIQVAYDLQAGSYVDALKDSARRTQQNRYAAAVAEVNTRPISSRGPNGGWCRRGDHIGECGQTSAPAT